METLETDLLRSCTYADSAKVTDRKRGMEELRTLVQNPAVVRLLDANERSREKRVVWETVFGVAHRCLVKEGDRFSEDEARGRSNTAAAKSHAMSLVMTVVGKANNGEGRLKGKELVSCILQVLENGRYRRHFGEMYVNILQHHVLTVKKYSGDITTDNWSDLLSAVETVYQTSTTEKQKEAALSTINLLIDRACETSQLALKLKKKFKFILESINVGRKSSTLQLTLVTLSLTLCKHLGKECRYTICKFGEEILPKVLPIYESRSDENKKEAVLRLLLVVVRAHHPCGSRPGMAAHWQSWREQLSSLYCLVLSEINAVTLEKSDLSSTVTLLIFSLGAALANQIFQETNSTYVLDTSAFPDLEESFSGAAKRRKISVGFSALLDRINSVRNPQDVWSWLAFLDTVISQHPNLMNAEDYSSLLTFVSEKLRLSTSTRVTKHLCQLAVSLLTVEDVLGEEIGAAEETRKTLWLSIWETTLRSVGLNQCKEDTHGVARALLASGKHFEASHTQSLVGMYCSGAVDFTQPALATLKALSRAAPLPESRETRSALADWILNNVNLEEYDLLGDCAEILFALSIKSKLPFTSGKDKDKDKGRSEDYEETELFYVSTSFESLPSPKSRAEKHEEEAVGVVEERGFSEELVKKLRGKTKEVRGKRSVGGLLSLAALLLRLGSLLQRHHLDVARRPCREMLTEVLGEAVRGCEAGLKRARARAGVVGGVGRLASALGGGAAEDSLPHLAASLLAPLSPALLALLGRPNKSDADSTRLDSFSDEEDNPRHSSADVGDDRGDAVELEEEVERETVRALLEMWRASRSQEARSDGLHKLVSHCRKNLDLANDRGFTTSVRMLEGLLGEETLPVVVLEEVLFLFRDLCRKWFNHSEETGVIIRLLQECARLVYNCEAPSVGENYVVLVAAFSQFITSGKYAPSTIRRFVRLVGTVATIDKNCCWQIRASDDSEKVPFVMLLLEFFKSPFNEVRMAVTDYIPEVFTSSHTTESGANCQIKSSEKLYKMIGSAFVVDAGLSEEEVEEEASNRALSVLRCLAGLTAQAKRSTALYIAFTLIKEKNISIDLVQRVMNHIKDKMKLKNFSAFLDEQLEYIFWRWYRDYKNFKDFPFKLVDCQTERVLYTTYKSLIAPILLQNNDVLNFKHMCEKTSTAEADMVKDCFPEIISCLLPRLGNSVTLPEAQSMHSLLQQILGGETMKDLLSLQLDRVLVAIFKRLDDAGGLAELCGASAGRLQFPESTSSHFGGRVVASTLAYLQKSSPDAGVPLLVFLCQEVPKHVHYLLHSLYLQLYDATTPQLRARSFHQYIALCEGLGSEIGSIKKMRPYIVRNVVHTLLHLSTGDVALLALRYLHRFLVMCLPYCLAVVQDLLAHIVSKLVPVAQTSTPQGEAGLDVLRLVLKELGGRSETWRLDPLPDSPLFSGLLPTSASAAGSSDSLCDHIDRFLAAGTQSADLSCRAQGLRHINTLLSERRSEVEGMYRGLGEMRGFSEDCAGSPLHRLLSALVRLASSHDPQVREGAGRCLGELGPRSLTTLVLKPESVQQLPSLPSVLLATLTPLLVDENPRLAEASAQVLRDLFHTKEGHEVRGKLGETEEGYLVGLGLRSGRGLEGCRYHVEGVEAALEEWCPSRSSHLTWVVSLTTALLSAFARPSPRFLHSLRPVCRLQGSVCEAVLPHLVLLVLESDRGSKPLLEEKMNLFFSQHFHLVHLSSSQLPANDYNGLSIYLNRASVQTMLSIVNFIRQKVSSGDSKVAELQLDYLHVAQAAQFCSAYFTSILYSELWSDSVSSCLEEAGSPGLSLSPLDLICEHRGEEGLVLQNLLWEAYKRIGELDAVMGCGNAQLASSEGRVRYYQHMGQHDRAIQECELNPENKLDLLESLRSSGLYSIAMRLEDEEYESAWRLGNWSLEPNTKDRKDYSSLLYGAYRSVARDDAASALVFVNEARGRVVSSLAHASLEVANSVYRPLSRLQALREIEVFVGRRTMTGEVGEGVRWSDAEPILSGRAALLAGGGGGGGGGGTPSSEETLAALQLATARLARRHSAFLVASRCLRNVEKLKVNTNTEYEVKLEEANLVWQTGDSYRARYLLRGLLGELEGKKNPTLYSSALLTYGTWQAETKSENPQIIIQKYFEKAVQVCGGDSKQRLSAADCLARYADSEYRRLRDYVNSPEYKTKTENMVKSKRSWAELEYQMSHNEKLTTLDHKRALKIYKDQARIDEEEITSTRKEMSAYLQLAVREHLMWLLHGEAGEELKMFRVVSLWLDNPEHQGLVQEVTSAFPAVPSYKFLPVLPQLVVRLTDEANSLFAKTLFSVIMRCCEDHPHHSVSLVLALANSDRDKDFPEKPSSSSARRSKVTKEEPDPPQPRIRGARLILDRLVKSEKIGRLVSEMQTLSQAYISLANAPIPKGVKAGINKIDSSEPIRKLNKLTNVGCFTITQPISKTGNYSNIIGIHKFDERYLLVTGINQPKRVECRCTDGVPRYQLVKGKDDLRQDAVMQQVFTIMNTLLRNEESTAQRKLVIRTYKVVPLSQRSGVIEWVKDTEPLGNYLVTAHPRYRPRDATPITCRKKLQEVSGASNAVKLQTYLEICSKFGPVFRHFFTERFPSPCVWFERRLAYTRSVATNSMIGYILGIGDRHVANILLDKTTAEVIHIDFGIAFEQGRILPTPETVPFRLTRDIEDGMGVSGIEGVLRKCCEETLKVLRTSQEPIVTALEVLLYDPLYAWTITPQKARLIQGRTTADSSLSLPESECGEANVLAERALQRLRQKLAGTEEGGPGSVEGQVNRLLQEARDPRNLCRLFNGWQAYL